MLPALLLLAFASPAFAVDDGELAIDNRNLRLKDPAGYAADLTAGSTGDRLFAARELRRLARAYARSARGAGDAALEARASLADLRHDALASAESAVVDKRDIRGLCADLLAVIGKPSSVAALQRARDAEDRPKVQKRIDVAIQALQ
jgi:hypothetical protein